MTLSILSPLCRCPKWSGVSLSIRTTEDITWDYRTQLPDWKMIIARPATYRAMKMPVSGGGDREGTIRVGATYDLPHWSFGGDRCPALFGGRRHIREGISYSVYFVKYTC